MTHSDKLFVTITTTHPIATPDGNYINVFSGHLIDARRLTLNSDSCIRVGSVALENKSVNDAINMIGAGLVNVITLQLGDSAHTFDLFTHCINSICLCVLPVPESGNLANFNLDACERNLQALRLQQADERADLATNWDDLAETDLIGASADDAASREVLAQQLAELEQQLAELMASLNDREITIDEAQHQDALRREIDKLNALLTADA